MGEGEGERASLPAMGRRRDRRLPEGDGWRRWGEGGGGGDQQRGVGDGGGEFIDSQNRLQIWNLKVWGSILMTEMESPLEDYADGLGFHFDGYFI